MDDKNSVFAYLEVLSKVRISSFFIYETECSVFCALKFFLPSEI